MALQTYWPIAPNALSHPALSNDLKQQILDFNMTSSRNILVGSTPHVYDLEECWKAILMFVICDE